MFYYVCVLLVTISDPCAYVILYDIGIRYYYLFIVPMLVTDNISPSYIYVTSYVYVMVLCK